MHTKINIEKIIFGVLSGWGAIIISLAIGFFTLPIFFHYMQKEELGIWMLFLGTSFFLNLADLGFSPVLIRQIAFTLGKSDIKDVSDKDASYYYSLAKYISNRSAPLFFILLFLCGFTFLNSLNISSHELLSSSLYAWLIFSLAQTITYYFKFYETTLNGHGEVGWTNIVQVVMQLLSLFGFYAALKYLSGGIFETTLVFLFRSIISVLLFRILIRRLISKANLAIQKINRIDLKPHLVPALDMFIISFGTILIFNTSQYFIAKMLGPDMLPDYLAASRLIGIVFAIASNASNMFMPYISRLSASGNVDNIQRLLFLNVTLGMLIQLSGVALIAVFADYIINLWLGSGHFVGWNIIWIFCLTYTLENHHTIFGRFGLSAKVEPNWGKMSLTAGAINIVLTYLGVNVYGLIGAAMSVFIAQFLTSNWYAIWKTIHILDIKMKVYMTESAFYWLTYGFILTSLLCLIRFTVSNIYMAFAAAMMVSVTLFICTTFLYFHKMGISIITYANHLLNYNYINDSKSSINEITDK